MPEEIVIPDHDVRQRIETDLDRTLFVEAGAGSGKTSCLVRRIAALLAGGHASIEGIAAITFTRKAAAELRQRLQEELEQSAAAAEDPLVQQHLRNASDRLGQAFLGTIHSFCARLLREHPFEAGLDPEFVEMEEAEAERLERGAWQDYLASHAPAGSENLAMLDELGLKPDDLFDGFRTLAGFPDVDPVPCSTPCPNPAWVRTALAGFLEEAHRRFPAERPEKGWDDLQAAVRQAERLLTLHDTGGGRRDVLLFQAMQPFEKSLKVTLNRWADSAAGREMRDEIFPAFQAKHVVPILRAWREYAYSRLFPFLRPAVDFAADRRRRERRLGYEDLLLSAARLLREHPAVRRRLARRFTHLLVDEFQDTDPIQAEVMLLLTGEPAEEPDWRRVLPRPGSLFVVGDPKQSIYRFRRADITTYEAVKQQILRSGGDTAPLTANFRSLPAVAEWASSTFRTILPAETTLHQAAYAPLQPVRSGRTGTAAGVRKLMIPDQPKHNRQLIVDEEARRIAGWIAWACSGGLRLARTEAERREGHPETAVPGDFLIITPDRKHLNLYARALEEHGLPADVTGSRPLLQSKGLEDLLKLLAAVADPEDPVPLLGTLRSSLFGVSDAELYAFRRDGGRIRLLQGGGDVELPEGPAAGALRRIHRYWQWSRRLPPAVAVERIVEDLGILPYTAAGENGDSASGALLTAIEQLGADEAGSLSFAQAVTRLQEMAADPEQEARHLTPPAVRPVRVMNLHKAKGLEAPVVFLADPAPDREHEPRVHVDRRSSPSRAFLPIGTSGPFGGLRLIAQPPGWEEAAEEEKRFEAAEHDRLLYVAATRARNLLVISRYPAKPEADFWAPLHGALADAPELEEGEPPDVPAAAAAATLAAAAAEGAAKAMADAVAEAVTRAEAAVAASSAPGYHAVTVTELAHGKGSPPHPGGEGGRGKSWGNAVHRMLAATTQGLAEEAWLPFARRILEEEGREPAEAEELYSLVTAFWETDLGRRIQASDEVLCEVPFGIARPMEHIKGLTLEVAGGAGGSPGTVLLEGVIDLVFREEDGWVLVDYKTDAAAAGRQDELVSFYTPQVKEYVSFWRDHTGEPVKEGLLVLMETMEVCVVNGLVE